MTSLKYPARLIFSGLLIVFAALFVQSRAEAVGSVLFFDSPTHNYLRSQPSDGTSEDNSISPVEVGAVVSVLLGAVPSSTLSSASSSKLNEILKPNPFDRPRRVFMLEVGFGKDSKGLVYPQIPVVKSSLKNKLSDEQDKIQIELPDEYEFAYKSLDGSVSDTSDLSEKEITDFASWLGGSYVGNGMVPLDGKLIFSLPDGAKATFDLSKKSDKGFIMSLISLVAKIRKAPEMHAHASGNIDKAAELLTRSFDGFQVLQEEYGSDGIAQAATELFFTSVSTLLDSLQSRYEGELVGVMVLRKDVQSDNVVDVVFSSRPSARWLEEEKSSPNVTMIAEVILVRTTLAWITGIIFLVATYIGVYLLCYMSVTRDTLLYSNVKLD